MVKQSKKQTPTPKTQGSSKQEVGLNSRENSCSLSQNQDSSSCSEQIQTQSRPTLPGRTIKKAKRPSQKADYRPRKKPLLYANDPITFKGVTYTFNPDKSDPNAEKQNAEYIIQRRLQQNRLSSQQTRARCAKSNKQLNELNKQLAELNRENEELESDYMALLKERDILRLQVNNQAVKNGCLKTALDSFQTCVERVEQSHIVQDSAHKSSPMLAEELSLERSKQDKDERYSSLDSSSTHEVTPQDNDIDRLPPTLDELP